MAENLLPDSDFLNTDDGAFVFTEAPLSLEQTPTETDPPGKKKRKGVTGWNFKDFEFSLSDFAQADDTVKRGTTRASVQFGATLAGVRVPGMQQNMANAQAYTNEVKKQLPFKSKAKADAITANAGFVDDFADEFFGTAEDILGGGKKLKNFVMTNAAGQMVIDPGAVQKSLEEVVRMNGGDRHVIQHYLPSVIQTAESYLNLFEAAPAINKRKPTVVGDKEFKAASTEFANTVTAQMKSEIETEDRLYKEKIVGLQQQFEPVLADLGMDAAFYMENVAKEVQEQMAAEFGGMQGVPQATLQSEYQNRVQQQFQERYGAWMQENLQPVTDAYVNNLRKEFARTNEVRNRIVGENKKIYEARQKEYTTQVEQKNQQAAVDFAKVIDEEVKKAGIKRQNFAKAYSGTMMEMSFNANITNQIFGDAFVSAFGGMKNKAGLLLNALGFEADWIDEMKYSGKTTETAFQMQKPELGEGWLKPGYWAQSLGTSAPAMLPSIAATVLTANPYVGAVVGVMAEGTELAGGVIENVANNTGDWGAAAEAGKQAFVKNLPTYIPEVLMQRMFSPLRFAKGSTMSNVKDFGLNVVGQGLQERWQTAIELSTGKGAEFSTFGSAFMSKEANNAMLEGGGMAAIMGGAGMANSTVMNAFFGGKNIPNIRSQAIANTIIKGSEMDAVAGVQIEAMTTGADDVTLQAGITEVQNVGKMVADAQAIGLNGPQTQVYVAQSSELQELQQKRQAVQDPVAAEIIDDQIAEKKKEIAGVVKGETPLATIQIADGVVFTGTAPNIGEMLSIPEIREGVKMGAFTIMTNDSKVQKQVEELMNEGVQEQTPVEQVTAPTVEQQDDIADALLQQMPKVEGLWGKFLEQLVDPGTHKFVIDAVIDQFNTDFETAKARYGERVAEMVQPFLQQQPESQVTPLQNGGEGQGITLQPQPIRQLGTGSNVYFETEKYRVNDYENGKVLLNVGDANGQFPLANIEFNTPAEAVFVAQKLQENAPNGLTEGYHNIDKIIQNYKEEYNQSINQQPQNQNNDGEMQGQEGRQEVAPSQVQEPPAGEQPTNNVGGVTTPNVSSTMNIIPEARQTWKGRDVNVVYNDRGRRVVKYKNGKPVDPESSTYKNALKKQAENYKYNIGTKADENTDPETLIENSSNPAQIAETYLNLEREPVKLSTAEYFIATQGIGKVKPESFYEFNDRNNVTNSLARSYFNKRGSTLDVIAKEISDNAGIEITPEEVAEYMVRFPYGVNPDATTETGVHQKAKERFEQLTGIPLTKKTATLAANQLATEQQMMAAMKEVAQQYSEGTMPMTDEAVSGWVDEEAANDYEEETFDNVDNLPQYEQDITGLREGAEQQTRTERETGESATGQEGGVTGTATPTADSNTPSQQEAKVREAKATLDKAQRELTAAENKLAKEQGTQADIFGNAAVQNRMFDDRGDNKAILDPLRNKVKEAQAAYDQAVQEQENAVMEGQPQMDFDNKEQLRKGFLNKVAQDFEIYNNLPKNKRQQKLNGMAARLQAAKRDGIISEEDFDNIKQRIDRDYEELGSDVRVDGIAPTDAVIPNEEDEISGMTDAERKALSDRVRKARFGGNAALGTPFGITIGMYNGLLTTIARAIDDNATVAEIAKKSFDFIDKTAAAAKLNFTPEKIKEIVDNVLKSLGIVPQEISSGIIDKQFKDGPRSKAQTLKELFLRRVKTEKDMAAVVADLQKAVADIFKTTIGTDLSKGRVALVMKAMNGLLNMADPELSLLDVLNDVESIVAEQENTDLVKEVNVNRKKLIAKVKKSTSMTNRYKNLLRAIDFPKGRNVLVATGATTLSNYNQFLNDLLQGFGTKQFERKYSLEQIENMVKDINRLIAEHKEAALRDKVDVLLKKGTISPVLDGNGEVDYDATMQAYLDTKEQEDSDVQEKEAKTKEDLLRSYLPELQKQVLNEAENIEDKRLQKEAKELAAVDITKLNAKEISELNDLLNNVLLDQMPDGVGNFLARVDAKKGMTELINTAAQSPVRMLNPTRIDKMSLNVIFQSLFFSEKTWNKFRSIIYQPWVLSVNRTKAYFNGDRGRIGIAKEATRFIDKNNLDNSNARRIGIYMFLNRFNPNLAETREEQLQAAIDKTVSQIKAIYKAGVQNMQGVKETVASKNLKQEALLQAEAAKALGIINSYSIIGANVEIEVNENFEFGDNVLTEPELAFAKYIYEKNEEIADDAEYSARSNFRQDFQRDANYVPYIPIRLSADPQETNKDKVDGNITAFDEFGKKLSKQPTNRFKKRGRLAGDDIYYSMDAFTNFFNSLFETKMAIEGGRELIKTTSIINSKDFFDFVNGKYNPDIIEGEGGKNYLEGEQAKIVIAKLRSVYNNFKNAPFKFTTMADYESTAGQWLYGKMIETMVSSIDQVIKQPIPVFVQGTVDIGPSYMAHAVRIISNSLHSKEWADKLNRFFDNTSEEFRDAQSLDTFHDTVDKWNKPGWQHVAEVPANIFNFVGKRALVWGDKKVANRIVLLAGYLKGLQQSGQLKNLRDFDIEANTSEPDMFALSAAESVAGRINATSAKQEKADAVKMRRNQSWEDFGYTLRGFQLDAWNSFRNNLQIAFDKTTYASANERWSAMRRAVGFLAQSATFQSVQLFVTGPAWMALGAGAAALIMGKPAPEDDEKEKEKETRRWLKLVANLGADAVLGGKSVYADAGYKLLANEVAPTLQQAYKKYTGIDNKKAKGTFADERMKPYYVDGSQAAGPMAALRYVEAVKDATTSTPTSPNDPDANKAKERLERVQVALLLLNAGDLQKLNNYTIRALKEYNNKKSKGGRGSSSRGGNSRGSTSR